MPESISCDELHQRIDNGYFLVQADDPYVAPITEESLSSKERLVRDGIWRFMEGVVTNEPDIYLKKQRGTILTTVMSETKKDLLLLTQ